jgi:p-cumate 2,3-dioxygenase subunit beta
MADITLGEIERFLVDEAALLDEWRLDEWLGLFAEDARYLVPSLDQPESDHRTALFLIADDCRNLASRVRQLLSGQTWAENPRSRTRRLITNFRILTPSPNPLPHRGRGQGEGDAGADGVTATANFAVWRFQHEATDVYVGRYVNVLVRGGAEGGLMFRERRAILDLETLRPHGKLSFIL